MSFGGLREEARVVVVVAVGRSDSPPDAAILLRLRHANDMAIIFATVAFLPRPTAFMKNNYVEIGEGDELNKNKTTQIIPQTTEILH